MNRKIVSILFLSVLCISLMPLTGIFENTLQHVKVPKAAYTPHDSIEIKSNAELADFCSSSGSGSGTLEDPYIIENFQISGNSTGISISNTNAYLCILNNEISHQTGAIRINNVQNINISGNVIFSSDTGILIQDLKFSQISANTFEACSCGIELSVAMNITFTNNSFTGCGISFNDGDNLTIDTSNKVNGKSVRYYEQQSHISLIDEPDVGQLILNGVNNSEFRGFNTSCGTAGITGMGSHFNTFSDIISNYNSLTGIYLDHSYNNSITVGDFKFNKYGVYLFNSPNTTVAGNSITNNSYCGLFLVTSGNSLIYYNSFIANHAHFIITMCTGLWDNGRRGNYWDDYALKYPSATHNGTVWNTPYNITTTQEDRYPLAYIPFSRFGTPTLNKTSEELSNGQITMTIQWTSFEEAEHYLVYRASSIISTVQGLTPISNTTTTEFTESVAEGTYYYAVVAVNELKSSGISNNVIIGEPGPTQPGEPEQPDDPDENPSQIELNSNILLIIILVITAIGIIIVVSIVVIRKKKKAKQQQESNQSDRTNESTQETV